MKNTLKNIFGLGDAAGVDSSVYAQPGSQTPIQQQTENTCGATLGTGRIDYGTFDEWRRQQAHLEKQAHAMQNSNPWKDAADTAANIWDPYTKQDRYSRILQQALAQQIAGAYATPKTLPRLVAKHMEHPMFNAPLSTIQNMWVSRFDDRWVTTEELLEADNEDFVVIARRLEGAGLLETHTLGDSGQTVYRVKE